MFFKDNMWLIKAIALLLTTLLMSNAFAADRTPSSPKNYRLLGSIYAPAALWDYASVDQPTGWLYIGRVGGVLAVHLSDDRVIPQLVRSALVHGVAALPGGLAAASNGRSNTVTIFKARSGKIVAIVPAGKEPDGIGYDSALGLIVVSDYGGDSLTLIDAMSRAPVGAIALGGRPEAFAIADHNELYDNITDKNEVAVVDLRARKVTARIALPGCREPTGLAFDRRNHFVISACENGSVDIISTATRKVSSNLKVGVGPDAVMFDATRGYALIPSGAAGILSVIRISPQGVGTLMEKVPTEIGARTGAVDPASGKVYLPVAQVVPSARSGELPSVIPGTFRILVYAPFSSNVSSP
jgi:DNA-binding beta-propeller fold protein YncE